MAFGLFLIDKPVGPTSHDIVARVRRGIGDRRVGHAGTLDPLASGLLIVAVGQATRLVEYLISSEKRYEARILLGAVSNTYDREGEILEETALSETLTRQGIEHALEGFQGEILQRPPIYSAVKVAGKSAHARARDGQLFELGPRPITIHSIRLTSINLPIITVEVVCSAGTYIRSLAHDLGQELGCGALLDGLVRTHSGSFQLSEAISLSALDKAFLDHTWHQTLIEADRVLPSAPSMVLDDDDVKRVINGVSIPRSEQEANISRAYTSDGRFFAVLVADSVKQEWHPRKVFTDQVSSLSPSKSQTPQ
jgi:tRNA pseudouridine55 synthase